MRAGGRLELQGKLIAADALALNAASIESRSSAKLCWRCSEMVTWSSPIPVRQTPTIAAAIGQIM